MPKSNNSSSAAPASTGKGPKPRTAARKTARGSGKASGSRRRAASSSRSASVPPAGPAPIDRLFDVTVIPEKPACEEVEHVPLDQITLYENPRKDISSEGIDRLAGSMMRSGQFQNAVGWRSGPKEVIVYAGQRRYLAAQRSPELAGTDGFAGLRPVVALRVRLLDHKPTTAEIRRVQAQENQHEDLSMRDKQTQFATAWAEYAGLPEDTRIAAVCEELGYGPKLARNLLRQSTLPEEIRTRVAERPAGPELSISLANELATMHETAPALTRAVAERISTADHQQQALQSIGAFVQGTVVADEQLYAVRLDEGIAVLDARKEVERGRAQLTARERSILAKTIGATEKELDKRLDDLSSRAEAAAFKVDVDRNLRERAVAGKYAWVHKRGADYADAIWVVAPEFVIAAIHEAMEGVKDGPDRDEGYFGAANVKDDDTEEARKAEQSRRAEARKRTEEAINSNLGLGHDLQMRILEPRTEQLDAVRRIVALTMIEQYGAIIAYGAGWSDREQQQPIGDTGRFEPRQIDAILAAELQRTLDDPDPLRGIMRLVTRFAAAFVLDRNGIPATTALGSARMGAKLQRGLPDGSGELRSAVWELMRPILSPRLTELNRDEFVRDDTLAPAADLDAHRAASALKDIDLGEELETA
jgi:ParB-like chromosome segregation protein Spo0J